MTKFSSAEKAAMRVRIAKDVIAQVKAKRFVATMGTYVAELDNRQRDDLSEEVSK